MERIKVRNAELLELEDAYRKVIFWFFSYPTKELSLNDLTKLVNISKTTANRIVTKLVKEGFLKVEILGKLWRIKCNQKHKFFTILKIPYNLELVYASGILDELMNKYENPKSIILFGSYRKGDDNEKSDIDIAVELPDGKEPKVENLGIVQKLGYRENVNVNVLTFTRKNIDINLFTNIANGIVLFGLLEVRK